MQLPTGNVKAEIDLSLHNAEKMAICTALKALKGKPMAEVASRLGVTRYTLNRLIRVHGLEQELYRSWPRAYDWAVGKHNGDLK